MSTTVVPAARAASIAAPASHSDIPVTYERIAAAIAAVTVHGAEVRVHWKDPLTGAPLGESTAVMSPDDSLAARLRVQAKRSLLHELAAALMRAMSGVLGGSAGRIVRDVAYTASYDLQARAIDDTRFTESTRRDAVVRAFERVRDRFVYDSAGRRFLAR